MDTLLVIDDNASLCEMLKLQLEEPEGDRPGFVVETAGSAAEARARLASIQPAFVLCDMRLPDGDGVDLLPELKQLAGDAPIVIMTAHADMETTIRAMKLGAFDYLQKPFDQDEVELVVLRALDLRRQSRRAAVLAVDTASQQRVDDIVAVSPTMKAVVKQIGKIAASRASVLIQGESGTGKELIARVIHTYSSDTAKPFVGINCSAIVDTLLESELFGHEKGAFTGAAQTKYGKFELAEDGTIFLDEIAEMSLPLQAKLLRVLQEREFERVGGVKRLPLRARIVAATNRDLIQEVRAERFREDLYQRLKVVTVELPPLRERPADIPVLVQRRATGQAGHACSRGAARPPAGAAVARQRPRARERAHPRGGARPRRNAAARALPCRHGQHGEAGSAPPCRGRTAAVHPGRSRAPRHRGRPRPYRRAQGPHLRHPADQPPHPRAQTAEVRPRLQSRGRAACDRGACAPPRRRSRLTDSDSCERTKNTSPHDPRRGSEGSLLLAKRSGAAADAAPGSPPSESGTATFPGPPACAGPWCPSGKARGPRCPGGRRASSR
jgi:DNA-binding NtrC family response regulator